MKLPQMKTGLVISALAHLALLAWGLISFTVRPLAAPPVETVQADVISATEFSQLSKGAKNAPLAEKPAPLVDKVGEQKPAEDVRPVESKPEINTASAPPPPPPPPLPTARPQETKPEKKPPPKTDAIADALKKDEAKRKAEEKAKAQQEKPKPPQPRFDPTQIAALLDKRNPRRAEATGDTPNTAPSLGFANGPAVQLSQGELDALRRRLSQCWSPPAGAANVANLKVVLRVLFKPDGSVAAPPELVAGSASSFGPAMAESAKRAILSCQPFTMLRPEHYQQWKDIEITFDPRDMLRS